MFLHRRPGLWHHPYLRLVLFSFEGIVEEKEQDRSRTERRGWIKARRSVGRSVRSEVRRRLQDCLSDTHREDLWDYLSKFCAGTGFACPVWVSSDFLFHEYDWRIQLNTREVLRPDPSGLQYITPQPYIIDASDRFIWDNSACDIDTKSPQSSPICFVLKLIPLASLWSGVN